MTSKTPQFDAAINAYYDTQHPGTRICEESGESFVISPEEFALYKKLNIPLPTVAPHIRLRRLRAHMGGIELFMRQDIHGTSVISMYDPESPVTILTNDEWHSDDFEPATYSADIDTDTTFFDTWTQLSRRVPRPAIDTDPQSENCQWSIYELAFKDAYATYGGIECSDVLYADMCLWSSHATDVTNIVNSEWLYDSTNMSECSHTFFSENCDTCLNCLFCFECVSCTDCFGCINLKNKKFCFFNKQLTEEEYRRRVQEINLSDARIVTQLKEKIYAWWKQGYYATENNFNSEQVLGDSVISSKDTTGISVLECNNAYNLFDASHLTDCIDITTSSHMERSCNTVCATNGYENNMVYNCSQCIDVEYCEYCSSCEHCFGCIGLTRKKYCIFNKQYTEDEYWRRIDEIKYQMLHRGEYGNFFPYYTSLIAYNASHADVFFPLDKASVHRINARWHDFKTADTSQARPIDELPYTINNTSEDILSKQYICPESQRPFRIVRPELKYHQSLSLALPRVHPSVRRKQRYKRMLGLQLFDTTCQHCQKQIKVRNKPNNQDKLLCNTCFQDYILTNNPQ